jgi:hypothetical protein
MSGCGWIGGCGHGSFPLCLDGGDGLNRGARENAERGPWVYGLGWARAGFVEWVEDFMRVEVWICMGFPFPNSGSAWWELLGRVYRAGEEMQEKCLYFVRV